MTAAGRPAAGRGGSPPRGLRRGGGFGVGSESPIRSIMRLHRPRRFLERKAVALPAIDDDRVALAERRPRGTRMRQRIEDAPLDRALERPRAVGRVVALRARAASLAASVSSTWIFRSSSRFIRPASWMSMICFMCSRPSAWKKMISSIRFRNSGRKCSRSASMTCAPRALVDRAAFAPCVAPR